MRPALVAAAAGLLLAGCNTEQSALDPRGPHAETVHRLTEVMTVGAAAILALVCLATLLAIVLPRRLRAPMGGRGFVVALGFVFPVVVLTGLLVWGLGTLGGLSEPGRPALRVEVVGYKWWWRIVYRDGEDRAVLETANEIHVPAGLPVEFVLTTEDVIHSFWVPALGGKLDMIPGRTNRLVLSAAAPGVYRGQCAEFCGDMHALMAFKVVAHDRAAFEAWWAREAGPAAAPAAGEARTGAALFEENGCGACHTVRGTAAAGRLGPDLTHIGSRLTIAAGTFPRNAGTLAGWVASSQHLKPGNAMPSYDRLSGPDLRALAAYLEGLE